MGSFALSRPCSGVACCFSTRLRGRSGSESARSFFSWPGCHDIFGVEQGCDYLNRSPGRIAAQVPDSLRGQTVNGMDDNKPEVAIGHLVMHVADAVRSAEFYSKLGLRIVAKQPRMSLVELLGGTHILLSDEKAAWENMPASRIGAKAPDRKEDFELMISGGSREDLEEYRDSLGKRGLVPKPIEDEMYHGHYVFQILDPDGNTVTIYTSHAIGPV